jgi:hypothetical protein
MYLEWTDDFDFPGGTNGFGHSLRSHTINNWIPLAIAAVTAAGAIASAMGSDDSGKAIKPKVLPETVSGNVMQDMEFLFDQEAAESMKQMTAQLAEWGETDRDFFESQFQPFQQALVNTNQALLPLIEKNSTVALDQNVKDLLGSEHLKASFQANITTTGADIGSLASNFAQQIGNLPSEEQRVGEAIASVEQRFGEAGTELKRAMAAKGVGVSEASQRDLAISKATAKAGAGAAAAEGARMEKLQATAEGVGVLSSVQSSQSQQLLGQVGATQAAATLTPQVGGVQDTQAVSKAGELGAGLTQAGAEKMLGQESDTKSAQFTQKGVQVPKFFSEETGNVVTASGEDVKSMELTHAEALAKALADQRASLLAKNRNNTGTGRESMPGSGGGNAPGGVGVGANDGSGGSGGVGTGAAPGGGGADSPGPAGSSGDTG